MGKSLNAMLSAVMLFTLAVPVASAEVTTNPSTPHLTIVN